MSNEFKPIPSGFSDWWKSYIDLCIHDKRRPMSDRTGLFLWALFHGSTITRDAVRSYRGTGENGQVIFFSLSQVGWAAYKKLVTRGDFQTKTLPRLTDEGRKVFSDVEMFLKSGPLDLPDDPAHEMKAPQVFMHLPHQFQLMFERVLVSLDPPAAPYRKDCGYGSVIVSEFNEAIGEKESTVKYEVRFNFDYLKWRVLRTESSRHAALLVDLIAIVFNPLRNARGANHQRMPFPMELNHTVETIQKALANPAMQGMFRDMLSMVEPKADAESSLTFSYPPEHYAPRRRSPPPVPAKRESPVSRTAFRRAQKEASKVPELQAKVEDLTKLLADATVIP